MPRLSTLIAIIDSHPKFHRMLLTMYSVSERIWAILLNS